MPNILFVLFKAYSNRKKLTDAKWDGHTHTELCRHGSGDNTALMIEKAIELNFQRYSITEHAPMPKGFFTDEQTESEFVLLDSELEQYFKLCNVLKKEYRNHIKIEIGLELDYLPEYMQHTKDLLKRCEHDLDEAIVSIHFMKVNGKYHCVDYSPADFENGLLSCYPDIDSIHLAYWELVHNMVSTKYHPSLPIRIGHVAIVNKFIKNYPLQNPSQFSKSFFKNIMQQIQLNGYSLDYNVGGLALESCVQPLITSPILEWCHLLKIPLIYGSDAHSIKRIGHFYDYFETIDSEII